MNVTEENLIGHVIIEASARQFWLCGNLSCACCPIFLKDNHSNCWRVFYDDEACQWRVDANKINYPIVGTITGDDKMQWRDTKLFDGHKIFGSPIQGFKEISKDGVAIAIISFQNGSKLKLQYKYENDRSDYTVLTDG